MNMTNNYMIYIIMPNNKHETFNLCEKYATFYRQTRW